MHFNRAQYIRIGTDKGYVLRLYFFCTMMAIFQLYNREIPFVSHFSYFFRLIRFSFLFYVICRHLIGKTKVSFCDWLIVLMILCLIACSISNWSVKTETIKTGFNTVLYWGLAKILVIASEKEKKNMIIGMSSYLALVTTINSIYIVMVGGQRHGHYFLLGSDNGCANVYFLACLFSYVLYLIIGNTVRTRLYNILVWSAVIVYSISLQIGAAVLWFLCAIAFLLYYSVKPNKSLRIDYILCIYFVLTLLLILYINNPRLESVIDYLFYGKHNSITSRIDLWSYFVSKSKSHLLFGVGTASARYSDMREGLTKYLLVGNCHNIFVEAIYHYGIIYTAVYLVNVTVTVRKCKRYTMRLNVLGVFLILYLIHGIVEMGIVYGVIYVTLYYYADNIACFEPHRIKTYCYD